MADLEEYFTQQGPRPDLAGQVVISQAVTNGYAFPKLFPIIIQSEKAGTMAHAPVGMTTQQGVEGRANSDALEDGALAPIDHPWSVSRLEGRSKIYSSDVPGFGDMAAADGFGGEDAGRKAWNKAENKAAALVFSAARIAAKTTLADHAVIRTLQQKAKAVRKYGKAYLVMTDTAWLAFCDIPEIRARLEKSSNAVGDLGYMALADPKVMQAVSTYVKFEGVILIDSEIVGNGYDNFVAVVGLRSEAFAGGGNAVMTAKRAATYGAAMFYIPKQANQEQPFAMSSFPDRIKKCSYYDAEGFYSLEELHTAAVVVCEFAASYTEFSDSAPKGAPRAARGKAGAPVLPLGEGADEADEPADTETK